MAYNSRVQRGSTEADALIPEDAAKEIMKGTINKSAALQFFTHRTMSRHQQRIPVLSTLPTAYWLTGSALDDRDVGLKQTTKVNWESVYLNAEEIAVIVPVAEALLDDVDYDLWAEIKPLLEESIAVALDEAVFFGTNKPSSWPDAIVTGANSAGNLVVAGTSSVDVIDDINSVMAAVEADGYDVNGFFARRQMKAKLRGLRDSNKNFLYLPDTGTPKADPQVGTLFGEKIVFSRAGLSGFATSPSGYSLFCGDYSQGIIGVRQDITYKMLDQAVIQDSSGNILYNLAQQDMVALRVVARFAWAVPNPVNRQQTTKANRYPFGVLQQKASTGGE